MKKLFNLSLFFRWYDLWMGAFTDIKNRAVYICPLPMVGIKLIYPSKHDILYHFKWKKLCRYVAPEIHDDSGCRFCTDPKTKQLTKCNNFIVSYNYCLATCNRRQKIKAEEDRAKYIFGMFYR